MWLTITEDDVKPRLSDVEKNAIERIDKTDAGTPLADIIATTIAEFRTAIKTNPANRLDADESTLPRSVFNLAIARIVWIFVSRAAGTARVTAEDPRRLLFDKSEQLLADIRSRKAPVEDPDGIVETGTASATVVISTPTRFERAKFNRL